VSEPLAQGTARFRAEREADWLRLEQIVDRVERRSVKALSDEDLFALPLLYRATLSSLSVARATSLDRALLDYLEALSLRAYFIVYGTRTDLSRRTGAFLAHDWPAAIRRLWPETLASLLMLLVGTFAGYVLVAADPGWFSAIVPMGIAGERGPDASAATLRSILFQTGDGNFLSLFATFLFTNNAQVAILSFALGFAFGLPTAFLIAFNGCMLGAMLEIYAGHGLATQLGGWLIIHGSTELFAIVIAGAAGFHIGRRVAFPGEKTRLTAAAEAGRTAATAMVGVVAMLTVAAVLEGVGRQVITNTGIRYAIGIGVLILWLLFFYTPRQQRADG
jgi:uncharacterized membrane protein SpoIIM required for sporulation